ncbi:hypothetical protein AGMMS50268_13680 [Spirochaetia bacterium]|nr:hypothetical protein AGMMS50268_13680 [Spirochaetia bacterium]
MSSSRIYIVTEGQTETFFVKQILDPLFSPRGITLIPCTLVTKTDRKAGRQFKGGISNYSKAKNDILRCLSYTKEKNVYVSTMFDLFRLPNDFPGFQTAMRETDPYRKVKYLESALRDDIDGGKPVFIPYLQLHEFEALLFSEPAVMGSYFFDKDTNQIQAAAQQYKNPELINGGEETAPSWRILKCVPAYEKVTDGIAITEKIGLSVLRQKCAHFNEWISCLESLPV